MLLPPWTRAGSLPDGDGGTVGESSGTLTARIGLGRRIAIRPTVSYPVMGIGFLDHYLCISVPVTYEFGNGRSVEPYIGGTSPTRRASEWAL